MEGREALALFPMTAGADRFREALDRGDAVVAYKFGRMLPQALDVLRETGRLADAVYGAGLGLPEEDIRPAADLDPDRPGPVPGHADRAAGPHRTGPGTVSAVGVGSLLDATVAAVRATGRRRASRPPPSGWTG